MKLINLIALILIMGAAAASVGCKKDSDSSIIPGYWSPGDFRPKGIAREKSYTFNFHYQSFDVPPITATYSYSCRSGNDTTNPMRIDSPCMAVYGLWITGTSYEDSLGSEGIAVKDTPTTNPAMIIKITRFVGQKWSVILNLNGVQYNTTETASIELIPFDSSDETIPAYKFPDATETSASSGVRLRFMLVRFTQDIPLTSSIGTITINQTGELENPTQPPTYWIEAIPADPPTTPQTYTYVTHSNLPISGDFILAQIY